MKVIFDVGMYDGCDTEYYLSEGYRVVSIEANPRLIATAEKKFQKELLSGQLVLVNAAICDGSLEEVALTISHDDLGSSSIIPTMVSHRSPSESITVPGMLITDLVKKYGLPHYMKIDIEGADRYCILPLCASVKPEYISFEAGKDMEELVRHLHSIGFTKFKAINQCEFIELSNQESIVFRAKKKIIQLLGYSEPKFIRIDGRFFMLGHSSGPLPWLSDGNWLGLEDFMTRWNAAVRDNQMEGWYDIQAM